MSRHEEYMKSMARTENIRMQQGNKQSDNKDMVNNPPHYNSDSIECIQAIEAALTVEEFRGYCKGNNLKYTWRERYKGEDQDLRKATWYLNRLLESVDNDKS